MSNQYFKKTAQVIDIFSRRPTKENNDLYTLRLAAETDGVVMLYGNDANPEKLFSLKIIGWGLQSNGETVGLVPWLNSVVACPDLIDPLNGHWEGYYNPATGDVFYQAPKHKIVELRAAQEYYQQLETGKHPSDRQEIPDIIGTHAILSHTDKKSLKIVEIFSWRLTHDGDIQAMIIDPNKVASTPVLLGDNCLYPVRSDPEFKYFFQYRIANRIKNEDPEAMKALSLLVGH